MDREKGGMTSQIICDCCWNEVKGRLKDRSELANALLKRNARLKRKVVCSVSRTRNIRPFRIKMEVLE